MIEDATRGGIADEVSDLIETLHRTEQRLAELTAGEVDSVASRSGRTYLLQRSQEMWRESEAAKQAAILNALPAHIALLDHEGRLVAVNDRWREFAGANECLPQRCDASANYLDVCDRAARDGSSDGARAAEGIRSVLDGRREIFSMEYECHSPTVLRWFLMTVTPLAKDHRKGAIVMHTDVSGRTHAELATRRTTALMQAVVDGASDLIYVKDTQGRYLLCNGAAARNVGLSVEELIGRDATDVAVLETEEAVSASDRWVLDSGLVHTSEQTMTGPLGTRHFHTSKSPYRSATGEVIGLICIARDLTEKHGLAADLEAEHARLVAVQNVARIGSWSLDLATGVYEWSEQTHAICETDSRHFVPTTQSVRAIIHPEDFVAVRASLVNSLKVPAPNYAFEHRLALASGVERIVEHRWQIYRDDAGTALTAFGTCQDITARRQAERELRESQSLLSMSGRLAHVGAWSVDLPPTTVLWSDAVAHIHELPPGTMPTIEEALGFFAPEYAESIEKAFTRCAREGTSYDFEYEIITARGRRRVVRTIGEAVRDVNGVIRRVQGALQDLTERRETERKAERLADQLSSTLETISDGFFTVDRDWRYTYVNAEAEHVLQKSRHDLIGKVIWDLYPEAVGSVFEGLYRRAMAGESGISGEALYGPWDAWIGVNCYPSEEGLSVYFRDVTSKRETQRRLELLEASVSQLNDMVVITKITDVDPAQRHIVFVNDAFVRATGYTREESLGRSPAFLNGPRTDREAIARLKAALERFEPVHVELARYRKDGSWYWAEQYITPVGFAGETYSHYVLIERDVSERKRNEDALRELNADLETRVETRTAELNVARMQAEQANHAKSSFLATMSHEIRTPMNGVIGMIDVLEQTSLKRAQVEIVKTVRQSAYALLTIVDDVLDFSKIEAGQFHIDHEQMDVEAVMEGVSDTLDHAAAASGVVLLLFTDPTIPAPLLGDAARLRQVLMNLVGNAVKFSSGSSRVGRVHFRARLLGRDEEKAEVEFRVSDNGIGMDQPTQDRLFAPFTQAEAGTTRRFGGTGLGLSISQRLVQMMGGIIIVASEPERGSTFVFRLTLRVAPGLAAAPVATYGIAGLPCLVIGQDIPAEDLLAYLTSAGASAQRAHHAGDIASWFEQCASGACVVIFARAGETIERTLAVCRDAAAAHPSLRVRFVVIEHGRHRDRIVHAAEVRVLAGQAMHRTAFLGAVAQVDEAAEPVDPDNLWATDALPRTDAREDGQPNGKILVAEDNEINQTVIRRQLALLGYAADIAATGSEALACLQRAKYDIVLTDLHMPVMDGYQLAARVREVEAGSGRIPIVALTANAVKGEAKRCRDVGMDDYMTKPVQLADLRAMLGKWIPARGPATDAEAPPGRSPVGTDGPGAPANLAALVELVGDDRQVIADMLGAFRRSAARSSGEILGAPSHNVAAADAAHMLKAGARSIGAQRLCDVCIAIEETAGRGDADAWSALRSRFKTEMDALDRFLDEIQANGIGDGATYLGAGRSSDV